MNSSSQNGSAIVWILIVVFLFAALGYAFTSGTRTGTNMLTDEQSTIYAQEITAFGNDVATHVKRLVLRGVKDTDISFGNNVYGSPPGTGNPPGHNPNCTTADCEIFASQGGDLVPKQISGTTGTGYFIEFRVISVDGVGTSEGDLVMTVFNIQQEVCGRINRILGLDTSDYIPPADSFTDSDYNGSYPAQADPLGDVATGLSGKKAFCAVSNSGTEYHFHKVLIAR